MISKLSLILFYKKKIISISILLFFLTLVDFISLGSIPFLVAFFLDENFYGIKILRNFLNFDLVNVFDKENYLFFLFFLIFLIFLIKFFLNILFYYLNERFQFEIKQSILSKLYKLYFLQDFFFFNRIGSSKIIRNLSIEVTNSAVYFSNIILLIKELIIIALFFFSLFYINLKFFLLFLTFTTISVISFIFILNKKIKLFGIDFLFAKEKLINNIKDSYNSFKEVKLYNLVELISINFRKITDQINNISFKINLYKVLPKVYLELFLISIILIVFYRLANTQASFVSHVPMLSFIVILIARFIPSFNVFVSVFTNLKFYQQSLNHIIYELNNLNSNKENFYEKNISDDFNIFLLHKIDYKIKFHNVNFSYSEKNHLFKNFNQIVAKRDKLLVTGKSGVGKTTFVNLLLGFIKDYQGKITLNDYDIKKNIRMWRDNFSYCPQQNLLIDDSFINNIIFKEDNEKVNKDLLDKIYKILDLDKILINLPQKELTMLGEFGYQLSGGQKQRVNIARALYKDRNILILDEATNALDEISEYNIINNILEFYKERTVILITHNENFKKIFNKILYLGK